MIRHILLISFKDTTSAEQATHVMNEFCTIPERIPGVVSVEWGVNNSPEGLNKQYSHTVLMTFADEASRENYLPHPEHEALKAVFVPLLEDIIVFDYTVSDTE